MAAAADRVAREGDQVLAPAVEEEDRAATQAWSASCSSERLILLWRQLRSLLVTEQLAATAETDIPLLLLAVEEEEEEDGCTSSWVASRDRWPTLCGRRAEPEETVEPGVVVEPTVPGRPEATAVVSRSSALTTQPSPKLTRPRRLEARPLELLVGRERLAW